MIAEHVSSALRREHVNISAALKHIEGITSIPAKTASKWYEGKYAPKSRHLLTLAAHYPEVLQAVCELMGMGSVWRQAVRMGVVESMRAQLNERWEKWNKLSMKRDKFVLIRVQVDAHTAVQLNQRQLWFLGQMQQGYIMRAENLVDTWRIHAKTARRDLKGLLEAELIQPMKNCQPRCYELL
jgi:Fic family protein